MAESTRALFQSDSVRQYDVFALSLGGTCNGANFLECSAVRRRLGRSPRLGKARGIGTMINGGCFEEVFGTAVRRVAKERSS
jgi:hypothetical protein